MINVGSRNGQVEITSTASRQTLNKIQAWLLVSRIMGTLAGQKTKEAPDGEEE